MADPSSTDSGVIQVLLQRLETHWLPGALDLKTKVDAGGVLSDFDIRFLEDVLAAAEKIQPLVQRHQEYQGLVARVGHLYKEIIDKAMENERKK